MKKTAVCAWHKASVWNALSLPFPFVQFVFALCISWSASHLQLPDNYRAKIAMQLCCWLLIGYINVQPQACHFILCFQWEYITFLPLLLKCGQKIHSDFFVMPLIKMTKKIMCLVVPGFKLGMALPLPFNGIQAFLFKRHKENVARLQSFKLCIVHFSHMTLEGVLLKQEGLLGVKRKGQKKSNNSNKVNTICAEKAPGFR